MAFVRRLVLPLLSLVLFLAASTALAAPRDKAAQKKIEEAIYTHFLNTDFDAAEGLLLGTIRACEDKCSPAVVGKAWMYVGVIRGSGRNDISGAQEAFSTAIAADPNVALDNEIATDPVKAAFAKVKGGGAKTAPAAAAAFTCTPALGEIETRRPVPLQCDSDKALTAAKLHYKSFGSEWTTLPMTQHEGLWRATIPCAATQNTGKLYYFVEGIDGSKSVVAALGSKEGAKQADVVSETTADPPSFPAEEPPARCGIDSIGEAPPPKAAGNCGAWGAACGDENCCEGELACIKGTCGEAECQSDSDCKSEGEECNSGRCEKPSGGGYAKNLVGLHFGIDWTTLSSSGACTPDARADDNFACFRGSETVNGNTLNPKFSGKIGGGFVLGTMRVMGSYERLFGSFGVEGRLGFAFNGGQTPAGGSAFLPVHAEVRLKYWILGEDAFKKPGFRPWVHVGAGVAQYDAKVTAYVLDCQGANDVAACKQATDVKAPAARGGSTYTVDATKQLGVEFVTVGGGVMYAVAKNHGVVANLNLTIPFASVGFVISPSVGYAVGF
jgi:hypothetical protein